MLKTILLFWGLFVIIFITDQYLKHLILEGFRYPTDCIDITYALNKGVAFSMFAWVGEYLKYIQSALLLFGISYVFAKGYILQYWVPIALLLGGGVGNVYDRFIHGGVVDYVYWHCGFNFAIFNFADVMIDLAVVIILYLNFRESRDATKK
jgi:signal peptidase II